MHKGNGTEFQWKAISIEIAKWVATIHRHTLMHTHKITVNSLLIIIWRYTYIGRYRRMTIKWWTVYCFFRFYIFIDATELQQRLLPKKFTSILYAPIKNQLKVNVTLDILHTTDDDSTWQRTFEWNELRTKSALFHTKFKLKIENWKLRMK